MSFHPTSFFSGVVRHLVPLFCTLLLAVSAAAQTSQPDIIRKIDGGTIEALVVEVSATDIQYRKFTSPQGAVYKIPTEEVQRVEYPNGMVDDFQAPLPKDRPLPYIEVASEPIAYAFSSSTRTPTDAGDASTDEGRRGGRYSNYEEYAFGSGEGKSGKRKYLRGGVAVELPARTVTGLEYNRIPMDSLLVDERSVDQYEGVYEWQGNNFASANAKVAWKMEWDNIELMPLQWTGYSWRTPAAAERRVRLKGNELFLGGRKAGEFVMLERGNKVARGFLYTSDTGRELFLWKVE
ncbi:MAG: hypothetical protein WBA12_00670 [Catalinimonas sp.]